MEAMPKAILSTLAYFSIFDYPLTIIEMWHWLYWLSDIQPKIEDFLDSVNDLKQKNLIVSQQGFLCLPNCGADIYKRQQNYRDSFPKYELARKVAWFFSLIPFVKAIYVCNSLAYNNSRLEGDVDLFIITKNKRLWLTRFLTIGLLKILKLRPTADNKKNKIDPTFFVECSNLDLRTISLDNDIYLQYWLAQLSPIYDPENLLIKLREVNKELLKNLPNCLPTQPHPRRQVKNNWLNKWGRFKMRLLFDYNFLEERSKKFQLDILPVILKNQLNKNKGVVANEQMIKMHSQDRRQEYLNKWNELSKILFNQYESKNN